MKIFVSHAPADLALAKALVECLTTCLDLASGDIQSSSVPEYKPPAGTDIALALKDELPATGAVIGLVSPSALASSWVPFELGTAWGAGKPIFPILTHGVDLSAIPAPLTGEHAIRPFHAPDITQLVEALEKLVGASLRPRPQVDAAIDSFVKGQPSYDTAQASLDLSRLAAKKGSEPYFDGYSFSELVQALSALEVLVPADIARTEEPVKSNALQLFVANADLMTNGLVSTWDADKGGGFLYHQVALKLLPYRVVQYDKLPPNRTYKQISLSPVGEKFVTYWNTVEARKKSEAADAEAGAEPKKTPSSAPEA
ncbi:toll/interleukin-1 receptor domain-containing protein [Chondromyces apiculatus]|uniref:TIR domain-containing protein n=1 Tax=Chondromyces apiculatus DSM 436 TaxID=1192034 RepID=A0A017T5G0_9BACT|nr:toll/interleukin-1 receptor domain-containing protein [Chondromyces apiculatus]EYF03806.1 Hypothetical protein CAP_5236 [Chondromyces apiculatus DSM 436]